MKSKKEYDNLWWWALPYFLTIFMVGVMTVAKAFSATYYVSTTGNDSTGDGSIGNPWASCNHAVNVEDYILWEDGTYTFSTNNRFQPIVGNGRMHCWAQNFGKAIITNSETHGTFWIWVSNIDLEGFDLTATGTTASCVRIQPISAGTIRNIKVANNICRSAYFGCVATIADSGDLTGSDYIYIENNICYNGATASGTTYTSGIDIDGIQNVDSVAGYHVDIRGNLIYGNQNANATSTHSDGQGIILDRLDGSDTGLAAYTQAILIADNFVFANGGPGIKVYRSPSAAVTIKNNLVWADVQDPKYNGTVGEIVIDTSNNITTTNNSAATNSQTCCATAGVKNLYGYQDNGGGAGSVANVEDFNILGAFNSFNCIISGGSCGAHDTNISPPAITSPNTAAAVGAPNCTGYVSAQACAQGILQSVPRPMTLLH